VVPIDFDVQQRTFPELALIAQSNFDERLSLADIPIELVLELERSFGVTIEDQDTGMQALRSVDSIAEFIRQRRGSAA